MGARSSRPGYNQWDINELSRATGVSPQQIHQAFMQAVGRDGQLDMKESRNLYSYFPGAQQQDP